SKLGHTCALAGRYVPSNTRMRVVAHALTDDQWEVLDPLIPEPAKRRGGRGRPWKSRRSVLGGVLWVYGRHALGRPSRLIPVVSDLSQAFSTVGPPLG